MRLPALVAAILLLAIAPGGSAAPACAPQPAIGTPTNAVYVVNDHNNEDLYVWRETNGAPGLQTGSCLRADGTTAPADTLVAVVPYVNCIGSLCVL